MQPAGESGVLDLETAVLHDVEVGSTVEIDQVLMLGGADVSVGTPLVDGAKVSATVLDQTRGPKILIFKKKRRKHHRRKNGHRQMGTVLRITDIAAA